MPESQLHPVIRHIRRLASLQPAGERTDRQLLDEFSAHRDEAAFAVLVQRYGGLVLGVCRHVLHHHQDAEDAFQATFLVLARNAASIRNREALASWLHGVAYRTAMKAKRDAARRRKHEGQVKTMPPTSYIENPQAAWREVQALLDEEIQRLPEVYRAPFVLCCLEGKSRAEAAEQLGLKEGTVSSRLARARKQLQERLARRGVALASALAAAALTPNAGLAAVPPFLVNATVKAALLFMTGKAAGNISAQAVALAEGITKAMTMTKLNAGLTLVLGLSILTAGAGLAAYQAIPSKPSEPALPAPAKAQAEDRPLSSQGRGPEARAQHQNRTDRYGDPLPPGALARMGTVRLRHNHPPGQLTTAFSPDGKLLASGGWDEIRLWDLATGKLIREIRDGNRTKSWCSLLFAPDGRWLAGAGRESVCIWDTATGRRLREFPANGLVVACSPDGKLLAASASLNDGSVSVWDTATGKRTAELRQGHAERVDSAAFTVDGTGLVTLSGYNRICHWDLAESKLRKAVDMPTPPTLCLALSPDGQILAVTPREGPTSLWDTTSGKERLKLQGNLAHGGIGLAFSTDGKTLATNTTGPYENPDQNTVAFWDAKTGKLLRHFRLPTRYVTSLHFCPDGRKLLTAGYEPVIRLWDTATGKPALQWPAHTESIASLAFTPDGRSLVSGSLDGTVRLWEVTSGRQVRELAGHRWRCDVVAVAPNGKTILSGGIDGCIRLQDPDGQQLRRILLDGPPAENVNPIHSVLALGVKPDSKTAVTWSRNLNGGPNVYHVWNLLSGELLMTRPDTTSQGSVPQFFPDGQLVLEHVYEDRGGGPALAAGAGGGGVGGAGSAGPSLVGVRLREVATGREFLTVPQPDGFAGLQAFAPDGRTVLTVTSRQERVGDSWRYDNALHFWELATRKERLTIPCGSSGHWIQRVAFAPDGRTVATARIDGTIQLWDLRTGKELPRRALAEIEVSCLSFSPDSRLLASGLRDGTILVWDLTPRPPSLVGKGERGLGQLEQWWADLADEDARRAYVAVCELSAEPPEALRLFRDHLRPAAELPPDNIRQLIADLDSSKFQRREAAQKKLTAFGEQAEQALRTALRDHPSTEQRRRIEGILDAVHVVRSLEVLRHLRAVEVLERISNPESHEFLENLAKGAADARLTKEAKASLNRLANH